MQEALASARDRLRPADRPSWIETSPHHTVLAQLLPPRNISSPSSSSPPSASSLLKVTLLQHIPKNGIQAAEHIDNLLSQQLKNEGRKADFIVMPENWLSSAGEVDLDKNPSLKKISEVIQKHGVYAILGTMMENSEVRSRHYVTSVYMNPDGSILGSYQKRRPVSAEGHATGNKPGIFETTYGTTAIMICFDIENEDIFLETVSFQPFILFNPTWIPTPQTIKSANDNASISSWRLGLESMSHKFEQLCIENMMYIIRCDMPYPYASGTSQVIGPYSTVHSPRMDENTISVFLEKNKNELTKGYETFSQLWVPPERERTAKKDRTGNRYAVRSFNGHKSSILDLCFVDPLMKIATASADRTVRVWNGNTLECLLQLKSHQDIVTSVLAHKLNRNQLWSCSLDKTIRAWDLNLGKNLLTKENNTNNNNNNLMTWKMVQQPQGGEMANGLFCADVDGNVRFFDIQSGDYVSTFGTGLSSPIHSICFADANLFALACQDVVQVWDVRKGSQALLSLTGHSGPVSCVQPLESESNKIISGGVDGTIRVWDIISQSNSDSESGASSNLNLIKVLQNVHDGNPVTGLVALNNDKILSVSTVGTMGLFDWRYNVFPKDKTNTNGAETESSGSGSSRGSTMVEDGVCLHRFFLSTKPLYGVAFEGKQKVATFGEEAHWRLLRFTQDMNVLDLKTKLY